MTTIKRTNPPYQILDPATLGRPIHLLRNFSALLKDELTETLRTAFNRRYRAHFEVADVSISQFDGELPQARWRTYGCPQGRIGFSVDRQLVLAILAYRYGATEKMPGEGDALPPETASEERLAGNLGQTFSDLLVKCIEMRHGEAAADAEPVPPALAFMASGTPAYGKWIVKAVIVETAFNMRGTLYLTLDESWLARLLHNLAPLREKRGDSLVKTPVAANQIPLMVVARLLEKEMQLADLLNMRVGEVIPISMRDADVLIDGSRLFTATVAENDGKLCLTCFEDAE